MVGRRVATGLVSVLIDIGSFLAVGDLINVGIILVICPASVLATDLLSADRPKGTTETLVAAILVEPNIFLVLACTHLSWLLKTELPGTGSPILRAPAGVATIHMGVGLPDIEEHSMVVNTLVGLG